MAKHAQLMVFNGIATNFGDKRSVISLKCCLRSQVDLLAKKSVARSTNRYFWEKRFTYKTRWYSVGRNFISLMHTRELIVELELGGL